MKEACRKIWARKEAIAPILYILAFLDILAVDYISATSIPLPMSGRMIQLVIVLLGLKILTTSYTVREWGIIVAAGFLGGLSFYYTRSYFVWELFLLLIASKNIDRRMLMNIYLAAVGGLTIIVGVAACMGIFGEVYQILDFRGNGDELRYCMGYTHPNTYHIILIQLLLAFIWLWWDKVKVYHFVLLFVLNFGVTYFTDSRTNLILGSAVIIAYALLKGIPRLQKRSGIYVMGFGVLAGSLVLSVLAVIYGTAIPILNVFNKAWTGRIELAYRLPRYYSKLTLFSSPEYQVSCDMGFVSTTYNYGIVIMLIIVGLMGYQLYKIMKRRDYIVLVGFVACLIFYLGEKFSSGEYITRNLLFIYMLGWGTYEPDKSKEQNT